jgi:hypothetical protein
MGRIGMMRLCLAMAAAGMLGLAGCASSGVAQRQSTAAAEAMARPGLVIVYDFVGTRDDLPSDSAIAGLVEPHPVPQTPEEVELGRRLGQLVAKHLVRNLNQAGIEAQPVASAPVPRIGDAVIRGEFIVIDEGSRVQRLFIGFGAGAADLRTLVEAHQVTATGLRPLGSAEIGAAGGRMPGVLLPIGLGAAFGNVAVSAAIAGISKIAQEAGPETIEAAARRTAGEISRLIIDAYKERGWL